MHAGLPFSILVVEDDPDDRLMIDEAFREIGYEAEVKKFTSGPLMLKYLESIEPPLYPQVIVLDNSLPGWDAIDILHLLKGNPAYKSIPVVIYTTVLTPSKKNQLHTAGAYACIEKGYTMEDIVQVATDLKALAEQGVRKS